MATPTLVQHIASGTEKQNGLTTNSSLIFNLPNPSLAGNCLVIAVHYLSDQSNLNTVTDDKGNTWVAGPSVTSGNNQLAVFYVLGATAGTQKITVLFASIGANTGGWNRGGWVSEFYNCQASGAIGPTGTVASSTTPVSITLSGAPTSGDLALMFAYDFTGITGPNLTTLTKDTNYTYLSAQKFSGKLAQYSVTTTSTTVGLTASSGTDTWQAAALVIHAAAAGTPPGTNMRIIHEVVDIFLTGTGRSMNFPCLGNLLVGLLASGDTTVSSISDDSGSNVWNAGVSQASGSGFAQIFYCPNAVTSETRVVTPTFSGSTATTTIHWVDVANATISPFDTSDARNGTQSTSGNLTTGVITPHVYGIVFNSIVIFVHTIMGLATDGNGHTPYSDIFVNTGLDNYPATGTGNSFLDEDDGKAHLYNTDTLPITFIYTNTSGQTTGSGDGVGNWASVTMSFQWQGSLPATPFGKSRPQYGSGPNMFSGNVV